ncbi:MAG TPA: ABC transporter ATP-binding protein [Vicinamibacterales bacterium]|nr:ABC transporter ATP-binding protein [Vicinamibacterales bacterium]
MSVPSAVEAIHLRKTFGPVVAIDDLTLSVPSGSLFGFLGPNGAGKSTTIGCLTGLLDPTSGGIRLLGEEMHSDAVELRRRLGVMPEALGLFDGLYATEFLMFSARMFGLDARTARQRVAELLEALNLEDEGRKRLADFSHGMRKRVAFAAAVIHRPDLLFLDEPFESIDPDGTALMKSWLRRVVARGGTVFLTTHVLEIAQHFCERVGIIAQGGRLVWEGDINCLKTDQPIKTVNGEFRSLEALFLAFSNHHDRQLDWL